VKKLLDILFSATLLIFLFFPMSLISIMILLSSKGPIIFWSERVGKNGKLFKMPKFRSMNLDTPQVATHLMDNPDEFVFPFGRFLRRTSLDELPQLFSILKGDMSFVGPRPALYNQKDLIALRDKNGLSNMIPGLTGWAQVNGRDELSIPEKVSFELEYIKRKSFWFDLKILWMTFLKVINKKGVSH
jgi:O-antigen biosynthesis protein WbqP